MGKERNLIALAAYFLIGGGFMLWAFNSTAGLRDPGSPEYKELQQQKKITAGLLPGGKTGSKSAPAAKKPEPAKPVAKTTPEVHLDPTTIPSAPPDQEISINLICAGVAPGSNKVDFDFRALWGTWKNTRQTLELAGYEPRTTALDLDIAKLHVTPKFTQGSKGKYTVKLSTKSGASMGQFDITETGKQVKLVNSSTPGYSQRLVFYDQERYLTAYRIQKMSGGKVQDAMGVLFVGQGWRTVDAAKAHAATDGPNFPKIDMVILPKEWMETNDINMTMRTLKRGEAQPGGGFCYS